MKTVLHLLLPALLIGPLAADTIRMRDGRELQGVVISEEGDEYVALIQVTATIRDQRRIPKNQVLEIVGERKDETAFAALADMVPTPDGLDVGAYDQRIEAFEEFLGKFPDSELTRKAEPMLQALRTERGVVAAGGLKLDGRMITPVERQASAYTLDSQMIASEMDEAVHNRQRTQALRAWDRLEKQFPNSRAMLDRIPVALAVMRSQLTAVNRELDTFDRRLEERTANLERVPVKDRERAKRAIEEDAADYLLRVAREREESVRWISLDPFQKEPMDRVKSLLESEIRRLENLTPSTMPDADKAWAEAWATLHSNPSSEEARTAIANARTAGLPKKYLEMLEAAAPSN